MIKNKEKNKSKTNSSVERKFYGKVAIYVTFLAVFTSLLHIWMNSMSLMIAIKRNAIHLGFMLSLTFLMYPASKKSPKDKPSVFDWILSIAGLSVGLYIFLTYDNLVERSLIPNRLDYIFSVLAIILILEAARRAVGIILPILSICFIIYAKFGYLFPGMFAHRGFSWARILTRMYLTDEGIFGVTLMVSASYVFMFILFGSFLNKSGTAKFFNDFALALAGRLRGGPAQVAVMASGLMGTISGSAQANVATTGSFTIPLMKEVGYEPKFAGAVEAAASTGGILMPPIMGAASFMMASFLGIPYIKVMYAGIIPALFYYFAIFIMVDFEAKKIGLRGMKADELPNLKSVLKKEGHLVIPIIVILILLIKGLTPLFAAFFGLIAVILTSSLRKSTRMNLKKFIEALEEGAKTAVSVAIACAVVGFIVGVVAMTGLGQVVALNIIKLSLGKLWLALLLVMIASIFLGMGLPATACYIITASIAAPALIRMGVKPLAAHFFAFYYGTLSAVVPPVALTSYTAAGIAGAKPIEVAVTGFKLAFAGIIIPFMFVYSPMLLMIDISLGKLILAIITGILGIICLGSAAENYFILKLNILERVFAFSAAILLVKPGSITDGIGLLLMIIFILCNVIRNKKYNKIAEGSN
ncbi:TRAP transporter, 4TM/12TM fusion protein [Caminicella sporogenes DSM 14501]|uniref:TRAP transporter, 4TM/12TM fusion protein n=1 Tax=Caminicella sporogenes DSM 14501 TaxID=1121266 RepID=A0A1M6NWV3_9FIRM|nr:TRAP transporter permease [Caminicella sporogenes]SHK00156.1 TRAP transporter, 4TM/12TM fusion protein [Caminicella sporogenes DSM 14501]